MAVKIDFGSKDSSAPAEGGDIQSHNADEVAKMQECITMIEAGEGERAIPILKSLISGEAEEEKEESPEPTEKVSPFQGLMKK